MQAGIIMGPSILGQNTKYMDTIFSDRGMYMLDTTANFGVACYIFITAIKLDPTMLLRAGKISWIISLSSFSIPFIYSLISTFMIQKKIPGFIHREEKGLPTISCALSVTFFVSVADAMEERSLRTTELGQISMSSAMIMEMFGWVPLILSFTFFGNVYKAFVFLFFLCGIILVGVYVIHPVVKHIIKTTPEGGSTSETCVVGIVLVSFFMAFVTEYLLGNVFIGSIIVGLCIPEESSLGGAILEKTEAIVMKIFQPTFFMIIGLSNQFWATTAYVAAYCLRGEGGYPATRRSHRQLVDQRMYTTLVLSNIFLTSVHSNILDIFYKPQTRLTESPSAQKRFRNLQSASVSKPLRLLTCIHSEDDVRGIISLLEASNPNAISPIHAYIVHTIDLAGGMVPRLTPYNTNWRRYRSYASSNHIMQAFSNYSKNSRGPVSIRPFTLVAPYRTMHNILCNLAEDKKLNIIIVPFMCDDIETSRIVPYSLVCEFNTQLQVNSPCTVAILVDRGLNHRRINLGKFSYNVLVIFIGGDDDREALQVATRMSGNPDVSITLMRIYLKNEEVYEIEDKLDESLIKEFKEKNEKNKNVVLREAIVSNSTDLINLIGSLDGNYEIIIVGKKQIKLNLMKELQDWIDYPELGVIGDMIASSNSHDCKMSVLVIVDIDEYDKA
ncbi:cation/H(+) antiporter 15-like [Mercurialis annua]|uniref:cation/H(+) antiporter 15-like n=1 Tax=Mercurialis annua TaxID=3986 RepID=UPI00215F12BF|nr:cation/H(+) antiporter 15-like [Mercurialis annua]